LGRCNESFATAVVKLNRQNARPAHQGMREKICCDLAQRLELPTPGALLFTDRNGTFGVAVRRVEAVSFILWKKACELKSIPGPVVKARKNYPLAMIAFDFYVGNSDRSLNNGNILVSGLPTDPEIIPIDFGNTLGTQPMPWASGRYDENRVPGNCRPLPEWLLLGPQAKVRAASASGQIENLPDDVIASVVKRAATFCGVSGSAFESEVLNRLLSRRAVVRKWITANL